MITAQELHKKGAKVFLLCRNEKKAQQAIDRINEAAPGQPDNLVYVHFDLTDLPSAKKAAEEIQDKAQRLDMLVNNAGIMAWPYELRNGIEIQFVRPRPLRVVSLWDLASDLPPPPRSGTRSRTTSDTSL